MYSLAYSFYVLYFYIRLDDFNISGEQNGYNIPEMVSCPNLPYWLSDEGARSLHEMKDDRQLPEHAKRLLCDAYMCMYQSPDVMMYR
jgi:ubiquitin thioesterase CYLD